ncbi:hypothetical protein JTB14_037806 [Gonioctena quinquepunctata]|nr:hypothetical protein JTB14_037806 [Gonioctena quinquepunctata]
MEVHFQCTIQICRYQCPDQCSDPSSQFPHSGLIELSHSPSETSYGILPPPLPQTLPIEAYIHQNRPRDDRRSKRALESDPEKEVGVNRVIRVVSTGDLTFSLNDKTDTATPQTMVFPAIEEINNGGIICMTTPGFAATIVVLLSILILSCLMSAILYTKLRPFSQKSASMTNNINLQKRKTLSSRSFWCS